MLVKKFSEHLQRVRLEASSGAHACTVGVLRFTRSPSVLMWGSRVFLRLEAQPGPIETYRETFAAGVTEWIYPEVQRRRETDAET